MQLVSDNQHIETLTYPLLPNLSVLESYGANSMTSLHPDHVTKEYAVKHGVSLKLRIWPRKSSPDPIRALSQVGPFPWLVWVNGGAFRMGSFTSLAPWLMRTFQPFYNIVSFSHRLAPNVDLEDMVEDLVDAFQWCTLHLSTVVRQCTNEDVAIDQCVLGGDSSGACLALRLVDALPVKSFRAVIDLYGVTDFTEREFNPSSWQSISPSIRLFYHNEREIEIELKKQIKNLDGALIASPGPMEIDMPIEKLAEAWSWPGLIIPNRIKLQVDMAAYIGQKKLLSRILLGLPLDSEASSTEGYHKRAIEASPLNRWARLLHHPPTCIVHGTNDDVVGIPHSRKLASLLKRRGCGLLEIYPPGGHGFDEMYANPDHPGWREFALPILDFVKPIEAC